MEKISWHGLQATNLKNLGWTFQDGQPWSSCCKAHAIYKIIIFNICLGAGSRQYCRYTKSPLGITPLKEIWESPQVKENPRPLD